MKSTLALYIGISLFISGMLAGCGQPGPLYMPKPPAKPPAAAASASQPAIAPAPVPPPPALPATQQ
ncbi:LPS translocon maturation chaperone LptM [Janthinobacterium fluminis]|uniref:Lipoprotein n=1 Tax=Janthinobacterium fluminis TaxID=2987524 RepID=A0ABT5K756_9BURK|nr:lipoprotein [Janthinobacterium fluminis]MDC8760270.1 lipoprotein [Janthinobacterium fluminis]